MEAKAILLNKSKALSSHELWKQLTASRAHDEPKLES